jgi:uncharacterized protein YegL
MNMKKELTELVFVLDKSGSMTGLESDTIGGFNSVLAKQKTEAGEAIVTTVLFDNNYELIHDRIDIQTISPMTDKEYQIGGDTALIDAIGKTIKKIKKAQKNTPESIRPEKTLFVIITDGMENASREYTADKVKTMIEKMKSKYGWEFIFLGANIDAVEAAQQIGIDKNHAQNYLADHAGLESSYAGISQVVSAYRGTGNIGNDWKDAIGKDFRNRYK